MKLLSAFLMALFLFCCTPGVLADPAATYPEISYEDLLTAIHNHQVTLIDCNGTESYREGHIPLAMDFETQHDQLPQLLPSDKGALVVAYCHDPR